MNKFALFTDASLNPKRKVGIGGYLIVPETVLKTQANQIKKAELEEILVLKRFENTSSTKLEVQTVLWAMREYCTRSADCGPGKLQIYSDSQCVAGLLPRRTRLERNGFQSRGRGRQLKNTSLYRKFYELHDRLQFQVAKVAGHTRSRSRNTIEAVFSFIDQRVRKALKLWVAELEAEQGEWSLYMIRCRDGTLYAGISNDVARRFKAHREMGNQTAKYLRGRGPLELVFQKKIGSKSAALKTEQEIKKLSKAQKEKIIQAGNYD